MTRKSKNAAVARPDPSPSEVEAMAGARVRGAAKPVRLRLAYDKTDPACIRAVPEQSDGEGFGAWVKDTWGTRSGDFVNDQMTKLTRVTDELGQKSETVGNSQLAMIAGIGPRNELEGALATQMVAGHELAMIMLAKAAHAPEAGLAERYVTMASKLQRTLTGQIEALVRLRGGGKQTVEVKHVYVNGNAVVGDGNQALFGSDRGGGGAGNQNATQSHEPDPERAAIASLSGKDPARDAVLFTGHEGP